MSVGEPLVRYGGRHYGYTDHRELADEVAQGAFLESTCDVFHGGRDIEELSLLEILLQRL